jgi:hypothetical protein
MSAWACCGWFQKSGASDFAFSSSRRFWAVSQSKTPPQQANCLLDFVGQGLDVSTHGRSILLVF